MEHGNEFAVSKVSESQLVAWPRVAAIAAMVSFSLPTFVTGLEVGSEMPTQTALLVFFIGSVIIVIIGAVMGAIGASTRLSSYLLVRIAFGDTGARLVNLAFAISLLGWFGVNINLFTDALAGLSGTLFDYDIPELWLAIVASICMTTTTLVGFRAINILSVALVPLLLLITLMLVAAALEPMSIRDILAVERKQALSPGDGISSIVGAIIVGAIILPDITRFARHWSGGVYTALLAYLVVQLGVMTAAAMAGAVFGKTDILEILLGINLGLGAFALVIAGSWVLNSLNLYSTVLSTVASFPKLSARPLTLLLGAIGVAAAMMNILDSFVTFLFYLSVIFIPVAGVIIVDYLFIQRPAYQIETLAANQHWNVPGIFAWAVGALFAVLVSESVLPALTRIAAVDAVLLSGLVYFVLAWRQKPSSGRGIK